MEWLGHVEQFLSTPLHKTEICGMIIAPQVRIRGANNFNLAALKGVEQGFHTQ